MGPIGAGRTTDSGNSALLQAFTSRHRPTETRRAENAREEEVVTATEVVTLPGSARSGPEVAALAPFYRDWAWSGTIEAGGMGPGTPAMTGTGRA